MQFIIYIRDLIEPKMIRLNYLKYLIQIKLFPEHYLGFHKLSMIQF